MADRFPSPFEMTPPVGAEGWEDLYSYSVVFSKERQAYEDGAFWFMDGVHTPEVIEPWDATIVEYALIALSQYNTRHYVIPPARGVDIRILNGYMYLAPVPVLDGAEIESRIPEFMERAGFYFGNWKSLEDAWLPKVKAVIAELEEISFEPLPEREDMAVLTEGRGTGSGMHLMQSYNRLLDLTLKTWNHHFEFLNLGYAAYLDFFGFCKGLWPSIPDQAIAKMVAGVHVDLFQPDDELKKLATLAVELGVDARLDTGTAAEALAALESDEAGRQWLAAFEEAKNPWFNFSAGSGFYHSDRVWLENLDIPVGFIRNYVAKVRRGESLARPTQAVAAERDRIVAEYRELIDSDEDAATFDGKLGLARVVFPYVENHNFYIEHWAHSVIWRKMKQLGEVLVKEGFFTHADDIFLLQRNEVPTALFDAYHAWAVGIPSRGAAYWPAEIERRKGIMNALRQWSPPPALGVPPEVITEPFTVMLWGVTSDSVKQWLGGSDESGDLKGFAASPGIAEGPARVISSADGISELLEGEILVAPLTAPSWAPVFGKIAATVTDVGGIMSHAAIVCREYGLPAVTGTAFATKNIKTGQMLRVDGNAGTVTILD
ncbi:PEP-utilizing enzyme [Kineosporia sp. A_224]|uniref:PEP-utilizing enzyme n=1 Tax=Kineosporia sp. A_224 TaxID=1962180 RepID=UPI000B4B188E|nr:PEP-utilizing enzyme [Kineosporia sp. A_224]